MKRGLSMRAAVVAALGPMLIAACTTTTRTTSRTPDPPGGVIPPGAGARGTAVVAAPPGAVTQAPAGVQPPPAASADAMLLAHAAQDTLAEIQLAHVAAQRATSPSVRQLAQQLMRDHAQAGSELQPIAQRLGVAWPAALDAAHQAVLAKLSGMSGNAFDIAFVEQMIADHARAVAMVERMALTASDPALRGWAQRQAPALRQHYATVATLHGQLARLPVDGAPAASPALTPRPR